jgi:predicted NBD/HSP70 family sugar kinase
VHLPDAPFPLGELAPVDLLTPLVDGPVIVDNDVNWAARAERSAAEPGPLDDFVYLFLGEGLGCAVVSDGEVRRGHTGPTGEIAHILTTSPDRRAYPFIEVFGQLGLRQTGSTAIDPAALISTIKGVSTRSLRTRSTLGAAVTGVLSALVALTDPAVVIIGGSGGTHPTVLDTVITESRTMPRPPHIRPATIVAEAPLVGARAHAVHAWRASITNYRHSPGIQPTSSNQDDHRRDLHLR